eukprot:COSAG02_NODE_2996_length_7581_cov_35.324111_7_plen_307_part_00
MAAYAVVCAAVIVLRFGDLEHGGATSTSSNYSTSSLLSARYEGERVSSLTSLKDELHPQAPTGIDRANTTQAWSSNKVDTQASFACCGVWMAGVLAATASSSTAVASAFSNSHTETTARIVLGIIAGATGVCCTIWLQWLFFEHPQASKPLNSGFSCPLVRWVPITGEYFPSYQKIHAVSTLEFPCRCCILSHGSALTLCARCAGLISNGFLAGQLAALAWLRLGVLSCIMVLGYAAIYRERRISNPAAGLTVELLAGGPGATTSEVRMQRYSPAFYVYCPRIRYAGTHVRLLPVCLPWYVEISVD